MATQSSVLAWRIPGMGEPGGLLSMGSHRVGHDWTDLAAALAVAAAAASRLSSWFCFFTFSSLIQLKFTSEYVKYDFNYWNVQKSYPGGATLTNKIIPFYTHLTILPTVMKLPFASPQWHYLSQSVSHLLPNPTHYFQIFEKFNVVHATLLNMLLLWFPWLYTLRIF